MRLEQIQKTVGGDLFEIVPSEAYSSNYNACVDQAKKEIAEGAFPFRGGIIMGFGSKNYGISLVLTFHPC